MVLFGFIIVFFIGDSFVQVLSEFFNNLNNPLNASLYTLFITIFSVVTTYYFSSKQETDRYERQRFQLLYMPLIKYIIGYYDVKTHWRRGHDVKDNVNEDDIEKDILKHINNNIHYSSSELMSQYISINRHEYLEDFKGDCFRIDFIYLCSVILNDMLKLNRKCMVFNNSVKKQLSSYFVKYSIYSILNNCLNDDMKATEFISWQWQFKQISTLKFYSIIILNYICSVRNKREFVLKYIISLVSNNSEEKELYNKIGNE